MGKDRIVFPEEIAVVEEEIELEKNFTKRGAYLFELCTPVQSLMDVNITCVSEGLLVAAVAMLVLQEVMQMYALGVRRYLTEFENLLEVIFARYAL